MHTALNQMITIFRATTVDRSITPDSLGAILQKIVDAIPEKAETPTTPAIPSGSSYAEYCFGTLSQLVTSATVEQTLMFDTVAYRTSNPKLATFHTKGEDGPLLTAQQPCIVEVRGFVTMRATDSYTADRILRWFRLDEDGERYAGAIITTHFTGTTQIFSVPVSYSVKMDAGDTLSLVHYSSSGTTSISANSSIYFKVIPV